ncbi:MAG TPA: helix-turn-helix transcriptional regulator [Sphingobium sp.]|nr:helix-turn-helix transcriptional regulator [Sphingobium sp.]
MALTRTDENELLTALYGGVFDTPPWGLFLTRLRARTNADICRIRVRPGDAAGFWREVQSASARTADDKDVAELNDLAPFADLRPGRVYSGTELGGGIAEHGRYMRVSAPNGGDVAVSMARARSDFTAGSAALLSGLASHLSIALRTLIGLERERLRANVAALAHARFAVGWLLLDDRGRILDLDSVAAGMLASGKAMRRVGDGRLRLIFPAAEALLEKILDRPDRLSRGARAAWMDIDPPVQIIFMQPAAGTGPSLTAPACLALVRPIVGPVEKEWRLLANLFHLTRRESALALRIAHGETIAEAGKALGLTLETARNYSKRIYAKTGARGQADLVRFLMSGVTAFA